MRFFIRLALTFSIGIQPSLVWSTTFDDSPRTSFILRESEGILVQSSTGAVSLYDEKGIKQRSYTLGERINEIEISLDERLLLLAGADGRVRIWQIENGKRLIDITCPGYIYDASFSPDSLTFCVATNYGIVAAYRVKDGKLINELRMDSPMSAAITSDSVTVNIIQLGGATYEWQTNTSKKVPLQTKGGSPIRIVKDGRYALLRSNNSGSNESLRVLDLNTGMKVADLGEFMHIERIRPFADGSAQITATNKQSQEVGLRFDPKKLTLTELWSLPYDNRAIDFDLEKNIGVTTDAFLRTQIIDLATGKLLLDIDNSDKHQPEMISGIGSPLIGRLILAFVAILAIVFFTLVWRRNYRSAHPGNRDA